MRSDALDDGMPEDAARADDFQRLEQSYVREERWEDLAGLLIERTESTEDPAGRARHLMRAAQIFETNLADPDRAFITLLAAFQEDPSNDELATALARMATAQNRWQDVLAECNSLVAEMAPESKRADMLVAMAGWYQRDLDDSGGGRTVAGSGHGGRSRQSGGVAFAGRAARPAWRLVGRAAAYLTSASANTSDPLARVQFAFDAAEIYRNRLNDLDGSRGTVRPRARAFSRPSAGHRRDGRDCLGPQGLGSGVAPARSIGRRRRNRPSNLGRDSGNGRVGRPR